MLPLKEQLKLLLLTTTVAILITKARAELDPNLITKAAVVSTDCGAVSGRIDTAAGGTKISTYRNIPYAVPPLKELRWKASSLLSEGKDTCWGGTYNGALENMIRCVNGSRTLGTTYGEEDCLVLSVRTPDVSGSRPVIVWIHGGGLMLGDGEVPGYSADADFTETMDAVTVNINYRLGVMGFMTVEEFWDSTTGNYANFGFSDQITALRWVEANIANFGGNPESVTIVGESGGATSVVGLVASPKANHFFHRAIAFSPAASWNTTYIQANERFKSWLSNAGCTQSIKSERLACMQGLDIQAVTDAAVPFFDRFNAYFDFPMSMGLEGEYLNGLAVVEPTIVPQAPVELAKVTFSKVQPITAQYTGHVTSNNQSQKSKIKVILSNTAEEQGVLGIMGFNQFANTSEGWDSLNTALIDRMRNIQPNGDEIIANMWNVYPHQSSASWTPQKAWDTIATDLRGTCPINNLADKMSKSANHDIYRLYIAHHLPGVPAYHSWDTVALFGLKNAIGGMPLPEIITDHMKAFQVAIQKLVKDFAYDVVDGDWKTYPTNAKILTNSEPWVKVVSNVQGDQCTFWKENNMAGWGWQN